VAQAVCNTKNLAVAAGAVAGAALLMISKHKNDPPGTSAVPPEVHTSLACLLATGNQSKCKRDEGRALLLWQCRAHSH